LYQVIKYEEGNVELELMSDSETKIVSLSQLKNNFCLGFCRTMKDAKKVRRKLI